jgi:membrane associated rhomboid family serine protease
LYIRAMITYLIIAVTVGVSLLAFNNGEIMYRFRHWPYAEERQKEYYRWVTAGFLHADYMHLFFNMFTLYFFGSIVEQWFALLFPGVGDLLYLVFYIIAIAAASASTYFKHKNHPGFASIGASGAVAAVLFAAILLNPTMGISFMFIPIPIPGFIFGVLYLWYSSYASKQGGDNIDHAAHFYGAVFGFLFPLVFKPALFLSFIYQLKEYIGSIVG